MPEIFSVYVKPLIEECRRFIESPQLSLLGPSTEAVYTYALAAFGANVVGGFVSRAPIKGAVVVGPFLSLCASLFAGEHFKISRSANLVYSALLVTSQLFVSWVTGAYVGGGKVEEEKKPEASTPPVVQKKPNSVVSKLPEKEKAPPKKVEEPPAPFKIAMAAYRPALPRMKVELELPVQEMLNGEDFFVVLGTEKKEQALPYVTLDKGLTKVVGVTSSIQAQMVQPLELPPVEVWIKVDFPKGPEPGVFSGHFCFCIDLSASMHGDKLGSLKEVMGEFLDKCKKYLEQVPASKIFVTLMGFDDKVIELQYRGQDLLPKIELNKDTHPQLKKVIRSMKTRGSTKILPALEAASSKLTANLQEGEKLNFIFLTDGDDNKVLENRSQLNAIKEIWEKHKVRVFALGFGKGHDKKTLETIVKPRDGQILNATYHPVACGAGTASLPETFNEIFGKTVGNQKLEMYLQRWSLDGEKKEMFTGCKVIGRGYDPWGMRIGQLETGGTLQFVMELPWGLDKCHLEVFAEGREDLKQRFLIDLNKINYHDSVRQFAEAKCREKNRT